MLYPFAALSDTQGNFLLNGNFVVSMSKKEINIQGAIFEYSGSNNSIERINSTDRLEEELVLQVSSQSLLGGRFKPYL